MSTHTDALTGTLNLAAEFDKRFTSLNGIDVPERISVPRDEWRALHASVKQALQALQSLSYDADVHDPVYRDRCKECQAAKEVQAANREWHKDLAKGREILAAAVRTTAQASLPVTAEVSAQTSSQVEHDLSVPQTHTQGQAPQPSSQDAVVNLHFFKQVLSVAIAGLYEHYKDDVLKTFSLEELSEVVHLSRALTIQRVEDLYKTAWNMLSSAQPDSTSVPVEWLEMVTVNLLREGVNKHRARELAEHFYSLRTSSSQSPEAPSFAEYGSTDFGFEIAGVSVTDGDKRLLALLTNALGNDHPAFDDLLSLVLVARSKMTTPTLPPSQQSLHRERALIDRMVMERGYPKEFLAFESALKANQAVNPASHDGTAILHVGQSDFETWYGQRPESATAPQADKQSMRDAYSAGMSDPLVAPVINNLSPRD